MKINLLAFLAALSLLCFTDLTAQASFTTTFSGQLLTPGRETPIVGATVEVVGTDGRGPRSVTTAADGSFTFDPFTFRGQQPAFRVIFPEELATNARAGLSVLDVLRLQLHIVGRVPLSEAGLIAGDTNDDVQVDVFDMVTVQRLLLNLPPGAPRPLGWWRSLTESYEPLPTESSTPVEREVTLRAIKLGDTNQTL